MNKTRHKITYINPNDIEVVARAQFGQSTKAIRLATGYTPCQIDYRLTKAKNAEGLPKGEGYRTRWRDGTSAEAKQVMAVFAPKLRRQIRATLPKKFIVVPAAML